SRVALSESALREIHGAKRAAPRGARQVEQPPPQASRGGTVRVQGDASETSTLDEAADRVLGGNPQDVLILVSDKGAGEADAVEHLDDDAPLRLQRPMDGGERRNDALARQVIE